MTTERRKTSSAAAKKPRTITERVSTLERLANRLERAHAGLQKSQKDTSDRLDHIEQIVREMPDHLAARVATQIKEATDEQTAVLKTELAQSETRQADRVTGVARQWSAVSIMISTLAGGGLVSLLVDLILAAAHLPHL